MTSNTYWDWYMSKAYLIMAAQAIVGRVPRDVRGVPAAPEGGELHDRPGAREDGRTRAERRARLMAEPRLLERHADARGDRRVRRERGAGPCRRRSASPSSTTTARSGARSRCRSSSASSCSGSPRWPRRTRRSARRQPWKAAYEKDYAWLGGVIEKHYAGDDSDVKVLMGGILQAFAGQTVEEYAAAADAFLDEAPHPTLGRRLRDCALRADGRAAPLPGGARLHVLHRLGRQPRLHARGHARALRHPARARDRQLQRAALRGRRARRLARVPRRAGRLRRRARQAGPHLEPDRPAADRRRRQLERRHPDAPLRGRQGSAGAPAARPARRRRAGVRLRRRAPSSALERAKDESWTVVSVKDDWATVFASDSSSATQGIERRSRPRSVPKVIALAPNRPRTASTAVSRPSVRGSSTASASWTGSKRSSRFETATPTSVRPRSTTSGRVSAKSSRAVARISRVEAVGRRSVRDRVAREKSSKRSRRTTVRPRLLDVRIR